MDFLKLSNIDYHLNHCTLGQVFYKLPLADKSFIQLTNKTGVLKNESPKKSK